MAYRPTERTRAKAAERRELILSTTAHIVATEGWSAVTLARVAREASVSSGNVYTHFADKGSLLDETFRQLADREQRAVIAAVRQVLDDGAPRGASRGVAALIDRFGRRALAAPRLAWALLVEPSDPAVEAGRIEFRRGYFDLMRRVIETGIARGELPAQNADLTAAVVSGGIGAALVGPLSVSDGSDIDQFMNHSDIDHFIHQLTAVCLRAVGAPDKEF